MKDLQTFFSFMNDISFPYVVLRNWDNLPYQVELGEHSDLDLLVYDLGHWKEIYPKAEQVYPLPRVQFKMPVNGSFIQVDVRHIRDGYYPQHFEKAILETREWNPNGFFTPNPLHHRIALAYHVVHHKNRNTYHRWLGNVTVEELLQSLQGSHIGWIMPLDPTVGKFNQYFKGATSVVEKEGDKITKQQTSYMEYDLLKNEERILRKCDSVHFPKIYSAEDNKITIEDCGEALTLDNLPSDWQYQLVQIIKALRRHNIEHRDIRPGNLMVKDGVIMLIDFGWSRLKNDPPDNPPDCLGYPYKPSWGHDDNFSMMKVIKEFSFKKNEGD